MPLTSLDQFLFSQKEHAIVYWRLNEQLQKKSFQLLPFHTAHVLYSVILLDSAYNTDTKPYRLFSIYMPSRLQLLSENTKLDQTRKPLTSWQDMFWMLYTTCDSTCLVKRLNEYISPSFQCQNLRIWSPVYSRWHHDSSWNFNFKLDPFIFSSNTLSNSWFCSCVNHLFQSPTTPFL